MASASIPTLQPSEVLQSIRAFASCEEGRVFESR